MCGIVGIAGPGAGRLAEPLRSMRTALGHRGPDAQGEKLYPDCALGHTRLSIIDLTGGSQPLTYGGGSTCVVFNGEIYGYRELRKRITAPLFTASDTELIPALYAEHGCDLCRHLPGMFAFALWDEPNRRLFCGRDRFGEKPLYWSLTPEGLFVFASELPALLASGLVRPRLNLRAVSAYLALRYVPEGMTIYEDVHLLPPGHSLVFEDGRVRSFTYWTAPLPMSAPPSPGEAREEFARLMAQAVRRCSVADVEVAVLLSGGLDSTTIAALASQEARLHAFSFGFEGCRNELPYARAAAAHYGMPLTELAEGELDLSIMLLAMPWVYGEPFADPSAVPTCALCRHVAKHVKVAVGGDGGDELLAGYSWYKPLLDMEPGGAGDGWSPVAERHWRLNTYFQPKQIAELGLPEVVRPRLAVPTGTLDDALRLDIDTFLAADILRKVDRAAMSSGLELRSPFLDRDLAEFLIALPWRYKIAPGRDKILLRDTFSGLWPECIRTRGKQGFGADVSAWQQRPDVLALREHYLFGRNRRIREIFPRAVYERFAADTANLGWLLLVLSIWLESSPCELPSKDVDSQPSSPQSAGSSRPYDNEVTMTDHSTNEHAALSAILDHVYGLLPPGANYGQILRAEAEFLADRVLERQPRVFLEIGTAAGVSTAVVYSALQRLGGEFRLIATECLEHCYFDQQKQPGFIFRAAHPGPTPGFSLHTGSDSFNLESILGGERADFVFIDGNHTHPWAAIDTILTLPFLAEGATLAYHDLNLHHRGGAAKALEKGPHQLFYHLPAAHKVVLGEFPWPNIGTLRLDRPAMDMLEPVIDVMLSFPWVCKDWPVLDQGVLDRLCAFVGHHWGAVAGERLAGRLEEYAPLGQMETPIRKQVPSTFRNALLLRLNSAATAAYDNNSQSFYQFGNEAARMQDIAALAAEPVVDVDAVLRTTSGRAAFNEELDTKAVLYGMLADETSREILVDLAAYRILGHRRVKLGYHGPDNVRLREDLLRRCMRPEQADPHLVADISPKWTTDLFSLFDLSAVGPNLRIYSIGEEIYRFMYAPSYHCTSGGGVRPEAGDVVLDCGAAFGDVSLQLALTVGESGRVVCFEPYPLFLRVFRENMKLNPALATRIEVVERAAWDRDGETLSFIAGGGGSRIDEGGRAELKITTTTIDAVVRERNLPRVDFIKLDIEGAELKALRGAEATLRAYRPKLAVCLYHSPQDFREIPEYLDSLGLGYRFHLNQHYMNQWETVLYAEPGPQDALAGKETVSADTGPRVNPGIANYFIGEQYRCQQVCITEGFWTPQRIEAENDNGSRPVLEWALTMIDRGRELSILDIGCGPSQKMARIFGPHANIRITGLDSVEATDLARRFNPGGTYIPCDLDSDESIAAVSAQMGTFDVIFVLDVIEHVLHPEKMIELIKAHSRPDTMVFLTTLERDLSAGAGPLTEGSRKPEHVREWNADEFRQFLQYMGLILHEFKLTPLHGNQWCQTFLCSVPDAAAQRNSNGSMDGAERSSSAISISGEQRIVPPSRQELLALDAEHYAAERLRVAHVSYPPRWVTIGISSMCTNHCAFCSYHSLDARDISNVYGLKFAMPLPRFKSQVDFFHSGRVPHVHICGTGEPFLHKDIMTMIDYVIERYGVASFQSTFNRAVITRGDYLPKILERRAYISYIVTDIHASNAAEHNAIKRGSSFEELLTTLQTLSDAGICVHGHFVLTRQNHASLPGLIGVLRERGIRLRLIVDNLFPHMFNEFTSMENVYHVGDRDIAASLQTARELVSGGGDIELDLPNPFGDPTAHCSVFWDKIQIWPVKGVDPARFDENLVPHACNAVVRGDMNSLGYVSDYPDVMALWNNPTLVALRTKILAGEAPDRFCWSCPCGTALKC